MTNEIGGDEKERRQFFRIDDTVGVTLMRVPEGELASRVERLEKGLDSDFTVMASLSGITAQMAVHLRRIENSQPDVAAYLKALDRKLEVLARAFMARGSDFLPEKARPVNLSAGGICLDVRERCPPRTAVEVRILLLPSYTGVLTFGDVVSCEQLAEGEAGEERQFRLRVEFTHIREQDRDVLIRHILRRQSDELRARREQD
jgi:hypothetical protein